ncbi:hypothetical protein Q6348_08020 [Isoptericola sp. b441]|uniref:Uncharacterized protein n=1 Tax=Actinotalea lenta TaxID=3064654 RepID=A0ABT9DCV3_9CELL|nr:hypothetical protein [Isoptericola sp. b441]MDO8107141.1 hypothetical protein [Isoptericola sp. b441]
MTELYAATGRHLRAVTLEDVRLDLAEFLRNPGRRYRGRHSTGEVPEVTAALIWEASGLVSDLDAGASSPR